MADDWTVEADGYRLVIEDGAIAGLVRYSPEIIVAPDWWPRDFGGFREPTTEAPARP